jgi:hypothetical protein
MLVRRKGLEPLQELPHWNLKALPWGIFLSICERLGPVGGRRCDRRTPHEMAGRQRIPVHAPESVSPDSRSLPEAPESEGDVFAPLRRSVSA